MGFRGEALASIAAVADVELRTKVQGTELGTFIHVLGSTLQKQETNLCPEGSNFSVKNIFFNIPARRKFLKSNSSELKYIIIEFQRIALANPGIAFSLYHNNSLVYELPVENTRKRIVNLFGKNINSNLIPVDTSTSTINISGFIGQPKYARKTAGEQFFFVNGRFMKHPFFHKAVLQAYDRILPPETFPTYFIYFEVDPASIDINIHPTKTEVKFEDERTLWHIIHASLREAIGKFNLIPSIDFDQAGAPEIPLAPDNYTFLAVPEIKIDPSYNPFDTDNVSRTKEHHQYTSKERDVNLDNWEKLYRGFGVNPITNENITGDELIKEFDTEAEPVQKMISEYDKIIKETTNFLQFKNKYIVTPVKSGLMVIDQKRAHERILYENFMKIIKNNVNLSQRLLFPVKMELNAVDTEILVTIKEELSELGFEISQEGSFAFYIEGIPSILSQFNARQLIEKMLEDFKSRPVDVKEELKEYLVLLLSQSTSINYGIVLKPEEISELFNSLFSCQSPNYSPSGRKIISIISLQDFEKLIN